MIGEKRRLARRCPNCGEEGLREEARFCDHCGTQLSAAAPEITPSGNGGLNKNDTLVARDDDDTQPGLDIEPDEGATHFFVGDDNQTPDDDDGGTQYLDDVGRKTLQNKAAQTTIQEDDSGSTQFLAVADEPDGGATGFLPPDDASDTNEGATQFMPLTPSEEEGATQFVSDAASAEITEEEATQFITTDLVDAEVEGETRFMLADDEADEEGATKFISERTLDDDSGSTRSLSNLDQTNPGLAQPTLTNRPIESALFDSGVVANHVLELQNRYQLTKILGKGGFGAVYLAEDIKLKRRCVVKQMLTRGKSPKEIEISRVNFEREAKLLVDLNDPGHPNIPEIYDYFSVDSGNYLVMKYIEGQNLKDALEQSDGRLPWQEGVRYAIEVCSALSYMHTHGQEPVLHRDIKPANIQLGDDGRVWLVDFGLAKADPVKGSGDNVMATQASGSFGYTPLEQWIGQAVPVSDIYALGATLHHLVTGMNPLEAFDGEFHIQRIKDLHGEFSPIRKINRDLPQSLEEIINGAVDPDPTKRPTALQLQQQLEMVISGGQETALYTFKSGESARTVEELVDLCERYRSEAQEYLYKGDFERWFLLINRNDLVAAVRQAVEEEETERDGLERFVRILLPNIFRRRLRRFGLNMGRAAIQISIVAVIVALLVIIGGSYLTGLFIQQTIGSAAWPFHLLELNDENVFDEETLNESFNAAAGVYFDETIKVDLRTPDTIDITTRWNDIPLYIPVELRLEGQRPHFYIREVSGIPLFLIADNISSGINNGVDQAFEQAPVDVSALVVEDDAVRFDVELSGRVPFATPTPVPTLTPTPRPTPTPVDAALVVIFNDTDQDVILEILGDSWSDTLEIAGNDEEVIEVPAGEYNFRVILIETGEVISQGTRTWTLKQAYRLRIGVL